MPRKLKTYVTSIGFFDLAIAAPSMKAALEAWDAGSNLFQQGFAKQTSDPKIITETMAKPGLVLKRPAGSSVSFGEHAELPNMDLLSDVDRGRRKSARMDEIGEIDMRKAALAFQRQERRRKAQRLKDDALAERQQAKRYKLISKAQKALTKAQNEHEKLMQSLQAERDEIEQRVDSEEARYRSEILRLDEILRNAKEAF